MLRFRPQLDVHFYARGFGVLRIASTQKTNVIIKAPVMGLFSFY